MIMEEEEEWDPRSQQGEDKEEEMGEFHQLSLYFWKNFMIPLWEDIQGFLEPSRGWLMWCFGKEWIKL